MTHFVQDIQRLTLTCNDHVVNQSLTTEVKKTRHKENWTIQYVQLKPIQEQDQT